MGRSVSEDRPEAVFEKENADPEHATCLSKAGSSAVCSERHRLTHLPLFAQ